MKGKQTGSQASAHFWTLHKQPGTQNKKKVRNKANPSKKKAKFQLHFAGEKNPSKENAHILS